MKLDHDLASIQEVRNLVEKSKVAQKLIANWNQQEVDKVVKSIADACAIKARNLAELALEETGFGIARDKEMKNILASKMVWEYCINMKTVGVINEDMDHGILEIAVPVGIIAALVPSTNPTSTTIFKSIISIKSGNSVIFSPHPSAKKCILETTSVIREALLNTGAPPDLVQCISIPTIEATNALLRHPDIGLILATGGPGMVKAAYSSGNPAIGVGAGNGPAFIERSADIHLAVKRIIESKVFDNGTICASEQSVVTEECISKQVEEEFRSQGGYFLDEDQSRKLASKLLRSDGSMNPIIVGKSAVNISEIAGIQVPVHTKVLLSRQTDVSHKNPYSREKLCPVLGYYVEDNWNQACERCIEILNNEGIGHTMTIHSTNDSVIREFALRKPVMRLLVNTAASLGGVGATTGLAPSLTLGCGSIGGSATSDNVTPLNLINVRRVAWGTKELEELRGKSVSHNNIKKDYSRADIERIANEVLKQIASI